MDNLHRRTGKASVDRPWLDFYPEQLRNLALPTCGVSEFLKQQNPDQEKPALEYYGRVFTWTEVWSLVDKTARALKAFGFGEGSYIPSFLLAVPEHLLLLLAAERIGAILLCRDDTPEELAYTIRKSKSSVIFAPDYISREDEALLLAETPLKRIVKVSPYTYADRASIPDYVEAQIVARYDQELASSPDNLTWEEFMSLGDSYQGEVEVAKDITRPLFGAYTSGSTSYPKLVVHSAKSIVGIIFQLAVFSPLADPQQTWLTTICPPALIAITTSWILFPLSTGKLLILDPFCALEDLDLEFMRYRPNFWPAIPLFFEVLMRSERIPDDFSMEFFLNAGIGAEPMNNKQIRRAQEFLTRHNCHALFSIAYGQSEGGSGFTVPGPGVPRSDGGSHVPVEDGCCGIPMLFTDLAIFEFGTGRELGYGELGEICKSGAGNMLGYRNVDGDSKTLQVHEDGKVWLHTGDCGYMTEEGFLYVMGRGMPKRFGGGYLFIMLMESKVVEVPGVDDAFFCLVPDKEHEGYQVPYLFLIPEEGFTVDALRSKINERLECYEQPAEIIEIQERPYFHFKTARRMLTAELIDRGC